MSNDEQKSREQLINELEAVRQRLTELELSEKKRKEAEETLAIQNKYLDELFEKALRGVKIPVVHPPRLVILIKPLREAGPAWHDCVAHDRGRAVSRLPENLRECQRAFGQLRGMCGLSVSHAVVAGQLSGKERSM